ncbi:IS3 family transposase [Gordonia sp. NB41Y]|uniref:IS3 family transposase n=1 Tax=Gordonia sp. NB41Y TaxID=875808 RepID=UPI001364BADE|nr:IS3 family transposase [Gordonia sp. NB41Y]WLP92939.1 IS3 family transposase [Gordonia sp. NB41Y]
MEKIVRFHEESDQVYGAPRITADLRDSGEVVSVKTVAKLMRSNGIAGISPRPWTPVTTIADQNPHAIPDLVGREFDRGVLNTV